MSACLFCAIVAHETPAEFVVEDDHVAAIRDINPQAPTHVLIIPREHITSADELTAEHDELWGHMVRVAQQIANDEGIREGGYRLVANVGRAGGQTVDHLHLHLLGGRQMHWPPG
jgi:histidine triad (HIT) family protein